MLEKYFTAGDKVELMRTAGLVNSPKDKKIYYSLLVDIDAEDRLTLTMPIEAHRMGILEVGERFWLVFYTHAGIYQTRAIIIAREKQGNVNVIILKTLTEPERIQRRQFYRIECIVDVSYRVMGDTEATGYELLRTKACRTQMERDKVKEMLVPVMDKWFRGIAVDISGGGMRFNTQNQHNSPDYIEMKFSLNVGSTSKTIVTPARVIRYVALKNLPGVCEFRVEFVEIPTRQREDIVQYVFHEDRKRRTKLQER